MTDGKKYDESAVYEIRVNGYLDESWSDWFGNFTFSFQDDETLLLGSVADQAALHGILSKINDLGLAILAVKQVKEANHGH